MNKKIMYGKNTKGKNLPPELTRSKANMKAIAFCHCKLQGLGQNFVILGYYLLLNPPNNPKNQNEKNN